MAQSILFDYHPSEINHEQKHMNTSGNVGLVTVLTLFLGAASWMSAHSQQSAQQNNDSMPETPIVFASRIEGEKAYAWLPTEPVKELELPVQGSVKMKWLPDHSGLLIVKGKGVLMLYPYNREKKQFSQPQNIAKVLGNPGVNYDLHLVSSQDFAPSPDKTQLVYGNGKGVYLFNLKTGENHLLLSREQINGRADAPAYFAWSHNGKQIAFSVEGKEEIGLQEVNQVEELYTVNADGTHLRHVGQGFSASWSLDDRYIVAIYGAANRGKELVRFDLKNGDRTVLDTAKLATFNFVSYSADGKQLAVIGAVKPDDYTGSLYIAKPDGKIERVLVSYNKMPAGNDGDLGSRADW